MKQIPFFFLNLSFIITIIGRLPPSLAAPDSQTSRNKTVCGPANATAPASFFAGLNATFPNLRSAISSSLHASAQSRSLEPVFTLFQCRDYLTSADCLVCFDAAAATLIRGCYPRKSGFLVSDGCTLGYRSSSRSFDGATNSAGSPVSLCEDDEAAEHLGSEVAAAMEELVRAVPKRRRLFAAAKVGEEGEGRLVYAVGQCLITESVGASECGSCLQVAYENVKGCLPAVGGWSANMECFLRYSHRPFFNESQVVFLVNGNYFTDQLMAQWAALNFDDDKILQ